MVSPSITLARPTNSAADAGWGMKPAEAKVQLQDRKYADHSGDRQPLRPGVSTSLPLADPHDRRPYDLGSAGIMKPS